MHEIPEICDRLCVPQFSHVSTVPDFGRKRTILSPAWGPGGTDASHSLRQDRIPNSNEPNGLGGTFVVCLRPKSLVHHNWRCVHSGRKQKPKVTPTSRACTGSLRLERRLGYLCFVLPAEIMHTRQLGGCGRERDPKSTKRREN